jgi:ABC-2 type transport system ATP-binding protein
MLQLNHIKKIINGNEVLTDVSFIFNKGQIYPILGSLGSGRTTLFECICEDKPVDYGEIITRAKSTIFYASKQSVLPMYITGYEYIEFLCSLNKGSLKPSFYLDKVGIPDDIWANLICYYSFEHKKLLQLAAFLIQKPYVILFDEPFDYCSEDYIDRFLSILNEMKDEHIILISTGLLKVSEKISKDTVILNNGELNLVSKDTMAIPEIRHAVLDILGEAENEII